MKSRGKSKQLVRAATVVLAVALSGVGVVHSARAAALAQYSFTGSSLASIDTDPASVASNIVIGPGLTDSTRFLTTSGNPSPALRIGTDETDGTTFPTAITAGDYFSATLTPNTGQRLVFTSFTFDLAVSTTAITTNVELQASINGGNSFVNVAAFTGFSTTAFTNESVSLTSFNNNNALAAGAAVTFRLVVYDDANNADQYTAFDNVTVSGATTAIPEPGTRAALGFSALAMGGVILRRRRKA